MSVLWLNIRRVLFGLAVMHALELRVVSLWPVIKVLAPADHPVQSVIPSPKVSVPSYEYNNILELLRDTQSIITSAGFAPECTIREDRLVWIAFPLGARMKDIAYEIA